MVRQGFRPRLKALGFKCSGTTFTWTAEPYVAKIALQKARQSNRGEVYFTANWIVERKVPREGARTDETSLSDEPASTKSYDVKYLYGNRIGFLLPSRKDAWWVVSANDDWQPVADAVVDAISSYVLPEVQNLIAREPLS